MAEPTVTITQADLRETARMLREMDTRIQDITEQRKGDATPRIIRSTTDTAVASDSVTTTEVASPTMIWGDANRTFGYAEWAE